MEMTLVPTEFYELPIFKTLTRDEVDEIGRLAKPMTFKDGEIVFREKDPANHLDIIWNGAVQISKLDKDGEDRVITTIRARGVTGEMSLMSGLGRSCTGRASSDVYIYRIRREDFVGLLDSGSLAAYKVIYNLAQVMSSRLRAVDEKLVDLLNQQEETQEQIAATRDAEEFSDFRRKLFTEWAF